MEYQNQIEQFWKRNSENSLGTPAIALYFKLLSVAIKTNSLSDIELSDSTLSKDLKITKKTLRKTRKILKYHSVISYEVSVGKPYIYSLINFNSDIEIDSKSTNSIFDLISDNPIATLLENQKKSKKLEVPTEPKTKEVVEPKDVKKVLGDVLPKEVAKEVAEKTKKQSRKKNINIPTEEEFLRYAQTLEPYNSSIPNIDFIIKTKYKDWKENGWKNGFGRQISNWKIAIANSLPFMVNNQKSFTPPVSIKRPKSTYNE